jgi:hypothetical protein
LQSLSVGFRQFGIFANWTRAFCHGLLLNIVDEAQLQPSVVSMASTTTTTNEDNNYSTTTTTSNTLVDDVDNNSLQISLISK